MEQVIIGVDPHKLSATIEAVDSREVLLATGRFGTDTARLPALLRAARQWPERVWAVEGANGVGRPLAQRLLADGERVVDVPAKLAARARVFDTGHNRKTDAPDAHAIAMVALRDTGPAGAGLRPELMALRMLATAVMSSPGPGADRQPAAPAVPGAAARRGASEEVHRAGQGHAGHGAPP